jgi:CRP-like cAMP-binding protein
MNNHLLTFVKNTIPLSDQVAEAFAEKFKTKKIGKGSLLLRPGDNCKDFIFVNTGILRFYIITDGVEVSVWFAFAGNVGSEIQSLLSGQPTQFFVEAIEDCQLLLLPKTELEKACTQNPLWHEFLKKIWEETIIYMIERLVSFQYKSAHKRYSDLLQDPDYLQQIPQKYLASYLGITPTSLSRLRRKKGE